MMIGVMFGAAKRLDKEGAEKYKDNPLYRDWAANTPSMLPFAKPHAD